MKAPPPHVAPITTGQLRKIIAGLGKRYCPPSANELAVLAAVLTGMQSCNLIDDLGQGPEFFTRVEDVKGGPARIHKEPPWLQLTFDADKRAIGHPRRRKKTWRDLAPDIAAEFRKAMRPTNLHEPFRDRDGPVAAFVAAVVPLIFPDQRPSAGAVGQCLARRAAKGG